MTLPGHTTVYADIFCTHRNSFQEHLNGKFDNTDPLPPSFFPPASYWTSSEKDLFFHGLTVYSRLRPDLIAEHIKTKSTFDVCVYLDALKAATFRECADTPKGTIRNTIEPAMEVSERWVQREEAIAMTLSDLGNSAWTVENAKNDGSRSHTSSPSDEHLFEPLSSSEKKGQKECFDHLDSTCLMVLESIIRESEADLHPEEAASSHATDSSVSFTPREDTLPEGQSGFQVFSEDANQSTTLGLVKVATAISPKNTVVDVGHLSSKNEQLRRLKKRLYMRRKRAEQGGRTIVPGTIKLRPGRPKRLRKPSKPRPKTYNTKRKLGLGTNSKPRQISPDPDINSSTRRSVSVDINEDENFVYEPRSQGGATKPYRVRKFFQEHEVDAQALVDMDLNFFHLSTLARLIRLYNSVHESTVDVNDISISANTIQLLVSITTAFVSEIIRRAVITKEQEIRLKRELKVWKYDRDEITAENVTECLNSMGLDHLDKEEHFARLLGQEGTEHDAPSSQKPNASALLVDQADQSRNSQGSTNFVGEGQTAQPLQFTLPQSLLWCSLPTHRQVFLTDDLLSEDIDQSELEREMDEEDELNIEDEKSSKEFEKSLWEWDTNMFQG